MFGLRFWCAVAVSVAIHGVIAWVFVWRNPFHTASAKSLASSPPIVFRVVRSLEYRTATPATNKTAQTDVNPIHPVHASQPQSTAIPDLAQAISHPAKSASDATEGYFGIDDVDQPAEPVGEWAINPEVWPLGTTTRLQFRVWISAAGVIDRWEIVGDFSEDETAMRSLQQLNQTIINPALIDGVPVPSYRFLEIVIDRE